MVIEIVSIVASIVLAAAITTFFLNAKHNRDEEIANIYRQMDQMYQEIEHSENRAARRLGQIHEDLHREITTTFEQVKRLTIADGK